MSILLLSLLFIRIVNGLQCFHCPKKRNSIMRPPYPNCFTEAGEGNSDFGEPRNCSSRFDNNCIAEFIVIDQATKEIGTRRGCTHSPFTGCRKVALDQVVQCVCNVSLCNYQLRRSAIVQQFELRSASSA